MKRYVYGEVTRVGREVDGYQKGHAIIGAHEHILTVGVERGILIVDIHEVEESALRNGFLRVAEPQDARIFGSEPTLSRCEERTVGIAVVIPAAQRGDAPVVKDGGAAVISAESLRVGGLLAQLLSGINHHGAGREH